MGYYRAILSFHPSLTHFLFLALTRSISLYFCISCPSWFSTYQGPQFCTSSPQLWVFNSAGFLFFFFARINKVQEGNMYKESATPTLKIHIVLNAWRWKLVQTSKKKKKLGCLPKSACLRSRAWHITSLGGEKICRGSSLVSQGHSKIMTYFLQETMYIKNSNRTNLHKSLWA